MNDVMVTYGDEVAYVPIGRLLAIHESHGRLATLTAVRPTSRFEALDLDRDHVVAFSEKPRLKRSGSRAFFVFERPVLDYQTGTTPSWSAKPGGWCLSRRLSEPQVVREGHAGRLTLCSSTGGILAASIGTERRFLRTVAGFRVRFQGALWVCPGAWTTAKT